MATTIGRCVTTRLLVGLFYSPGKSCNVPLQYAIERLASFWAVTRRDKSDGYTGGCRQIGGPEGYSCAAGAVAARACTPGWSDLGCDQSAGDGARVGAAEHTGPARCGARSGTRRA